VQLDDVWIRFGEFVAARDINITIEGGEFFSFLGPSGCGKTTLLRAVSGFLEPRAIQRRVGITFIYITHDQGEALTMSDHVAVMSHGVIEQVGDGNAIYNRPQSAFVASFVGENNLFTGVVTAVDGDGDGAGEGDGYATVDTPAGRLRARHAQRDGRAQLRVGDAAFVFVRPESLKFAAGEAFDNRIAARIHQQEFEGNLWQVFCDVDGVDKRVKLSLVNDGDAIGRGPGDHVALGFNADLAVALPHGDLAAE